ncbi:MAG: hypothetical protein EXR72_12760 [Myxococcales bacterium]|nr:hypothetical protein [Myxococcales bacterium]
MGFDVVYVSPHRDDAVFSAGGAIALEVRAGLRVAVATVFSCGDGSDDEERRREDLVAIASLGAEAIDLGFAEAPARDPKLRRSARIFAPIGPGSLPLVDAVRAAVRAVVGAAAVVAPLGVGGHVDHQVVHAACAGFGPRVAFYEDLPYGLCAPLVARRLEGLGGPPARPGAPRALWLIARWWAGRPVLREVGPAALVPLSAAAIAWRQWRVAPSRGGALWIEEHIAVEAVIEDKLAAIAAYRSQWPRFHATLDGWRAALCEHALRAGATGAIERRWRRE